MKTVPNIYKRKDGRWEARYKIGYNTNGKIKYKSIYANSYNKVKAKLEEYINLVPINNTPYNYSNEIAVTELFNLWLNNLSKFIKQSTYANYFSKIQNHILPFFQIYKTSQLNKQIFKNFADFLYSKNLKPKTIQDIISIVNNCFNSETAQNYLVFSKIQSPKVPNKTVDVFTVKEQQILEEYLQKEINLYKLGILLSLYTGIRIGELCALQWKDIDFDNQLLTINKTLQRIKNCDINAKSKTKIIIDTPKSQSSIRTIPLSDFIFDFLIRLKPNYTNNDYILSGTMNYIEPRVMQYNFKIYLQNSNIKEKNFHTLRHTFATRYYEKTFDIKSLSEILGHSNIKTTLEKYVHPSIEQKHKNIQMLNPFYNCQINGQILPREPLM